jgi:peptidoglycan/LPS O-acetylase OafA/YrhL
MDRYLVFELQSLTRVFEFGLMGFLLLSGMMGVDAKYDLKKFSPARMLGRIGNASYSLYLSHWFVLSLIGKLAALVPGIPLPLMIAWHITSIASAIVFAVLFAEYIELPLHKKLLYHLKSRRAVVPETRAEGKARNDNIAELATPAA